MSSLCPHLRNHFSVIVEGMVKTASACPDNVIFQQFSPFENILAAPSSEGLRMTVDNESAISGS